MATQLEKCGTCGKLLITERCSKAFAPWLSNRARCPYCGHEKTIDERFAYSYKPVPPGWEELLV